MRFEACLGGFADTEARLVKQWASMDPAYDDNAWDLTIASVAKKKQLGGGVDLRALAASRGVLWQRSVGRSKRVVESPGG